MADVIVQSAMDELALTDQNINDATESVLRFMWNRCFDNAMKGIEIKFVDNRFSCVRTFQMSFSVIPTERLRELLQIEEATGGIQQLNWDAERGRYRVPRFVPSDAGEIQRKRSNL
jgi:hypothetical protein